MALAIKVPGFTGGKAVVLDPLTRDANSGVRLIYDLAFDYCYPGGGSPGNRPAPAAPATGAIVYDASGLGNNATVQIPAGSAIGYAGGGFDYSNATAFDTVMLGPALGGSVTSDIFSVVNADSQKFMVCLYLKVPLLAEFPTSGSIKPIVTFSNGPYNQPTADMLSLGFGSSGGSFAARRQTAGATADALGVSPANGHYGTVCQLAFWRNAAGQGLRLRGAAGTALATAAVGAQNAGDFSNRVPRIGIPNAFWSTPIAGTDLSTNNFRIHRVFVENLARSGRDPIAVLDADFDRVSKRGVFS